MNQPINPSEEFVQKLCWRSFLALWSYANPQGKRGKELCDALVVCDPDIIIISVKEINLTNTQDPLIEWTRWQREAITKSVDQIYGAERWIKRAPGVIRKDGTPGLSFPNTENRRVHRIAVALGSQGKVPMEFGDFGKGFVHVFDETSLAIIMNELDTVSDFVRYLTAKEALCKSIKNSVFTCTEEDFLAVYLHGGRTFQSEFDVLVLNAGLWDEFSSKDEFRAKKAADKDSYVWDNLIDLINKDILEGNLEFGPPLKDSEIALRTMAREDRFSRRILGKNFTSFLDLSREKSLARMIVSPSSVVYIFLAIPRGCDRQIRVDELWKRCFVARGINCDSTTIVGLATERYEPGQGYSIDIVFLHKPNWSSVDQERMERMQVDLGYFVNPSETSTPEDEYPRGEHEGE